MFSTAVLQNLLTPIIILKKNDRIVVSSWHCLNCFIISRHPFGPVQTNRHRRPHLPNQQQQQQPPYSSLWTNETINNVLTAWAPVLWKLILYSCSIYARLRAEYLLNLKRFAYRFSACCNLQYCCCCRWFCVFFYFVSLFPEVACCFGFPPLGKHLRNAASARMKFRD